ncbi:MAG: DNA mismatch repair protein [Polyangiaceae bacterium]|nr:DNA mismatch repair protein [Polyangiaceae bacterium]
MAVTEPPTIPDLLHPTPLLRIDLEKTRLGLSLAFAGGVSGGLFEEALDQAVLAPSSWQPAAFESDLFLRRFAAGCFKIRAGREEGPLAANHLVRLLGHPPSERAVVEHRRAILAELSSSAELRARAEELYRALRRLRALLENTSGARNWDPSRRQLDILLVVKEVFDLMATGFVSSRSGLAVLGAFAGRLVMGEPYRSLSDLLRYDERLATLNLKVAVGADGRIRGFQVLSVAEAADNPFVSPPWRRWLAKLELFARGYRFSDAEVMTRLVDAVFMGLEDDIVVLVQLLGDLEFYLGALGFADQARAAGLEVCLPELVSADAPRALMGLFNPLLLMSGIQPVPCDLVSSRLATTMLVTGPNSGGKTRLLQSVGLTQLLAQCGAFIPARSGAVAISPALVVSLIQETKADQAEGRLGMELLRIRDLFERLPPGAMVLLDELCSGTNPSEGEEIFELVVEMLSKLAPQAFITTHFLTFAARLAREKKIPDLGFVQVELGADRRATYQFVPGVATTSLAGHAAERLGVTGEQLMSLIERNVEQFRAKHR